MHLNLLSEPFLFHDLWDSLVGSRFGGYHCISVIFHMTDPLIWWSTAMPPIICHHSIIDLLLQFRWYLPQSKNIRKLMLIEWNWSFKSPSKLTQGSIFQCKNEMSLFDMYLFPFQLNNIHNIAYRYLIVWFKI